MFTSKDGQELDHLICVSLCSTNCVDNAIYASIWFTIIIIATGAGGGISKIYSFLFENCQYEEQEDDFVYNKK